ncbi:hypothetical protein [Chlamydia gallinacea]|uniref:hypothetical protein n=1 Tax=Chlamydia gallinacea TaxID=1457153 RepID=UPI00098F7226|nr:hypothetical protein [Chlamydia gallinacea]AQT77382.1 hypothetical protein B1F83_01830 [Chlamydia gallinacea]
MKIIYLCRKHDLSYELIEKGSSKDTTAMKTKWLISLLIFTSPMMLLPGCTLIPQESCAPTPSSLHV